MQENNLFGKKIALLLDFDGTLVELADDPVKVIIPPELTDALGKIMTESLTPIAIVTGRQIKVLDGFLGLPNLAVSGNHGTELRLPGSETVTRHVPPIPNTFRLALTSFCAEFGCHLEDKHETAVVRTPHDAAFHAIRNELQNVLSEHFQNYILWPVGLSLEVHHRGFSKVTGIQDMLGTKAFSGYAPVYIGDDVETYPGLDSLAARVSMIPVGKSGKGFSSPRAVRAFLTDFAEHRKADDNSAAALFAQLGCLYRGV